MNGRKILTTVLVASMAMALFTKGAAIAMVYEDRAAINEEGNETTAMGGTTRTKAVDASHPSSGSTFVLVPGATYDVTASGTFKYEGDLVADAECTKGSDGRWTARRLVDQSGRDTWDLAMSEYSRPLIQFDWVPVLPYGSSQQGESACSSVNRYTASFTKGTGANDGYFFVIDDWAGNSGAITVTLSRGPFEGARRFGDQPYQCGKRSGEALRNEGGTVGEIQHARVTIDARTPTDGFTAPQKDGFGQHIYPYWHESGFLGVYTCNWALPGSVYRITVGGTWTYDAESASPFSQADAACTTGVSDGNWLPNRYPADPLYPVNTWSSQDTMDLYVNSRWVPWQPNKPFAATISRGCSTDNVYVLPAFSPSEAGPIRFQIADWAYQTANNAGLLDITIERIS